MPRPDDKTYEKLQWLLKRLSAAEDYCRPYFERAKRHYRLYRFGSAVDEADWPYVNRTRTRDILAFVEDSTALMVQTLFASEPFFNVDPRRTTQFEAMTGLNPMVIAKQMEICLENQIADEATEFFEEIIDMFKGGCIHGNGYAGVYPRFGFDGKYIGPLIKTNDFWDVLPITGARRISKARGLFIREFMSLEEAKDLAKKAGREDIIPQLGTIPGDDVTWHKALLAEVGITDYEVDPEEIEIIHYFSGGHIITMANRAVIVRDSNEPVQNS